MNEQPTPVFRTMDAQVLCGRMVVYDSHGEAVEGIPQQWRAFRATYPQFGSRSAFCGASPCSDDGKLHYMTGVASQGGQDIPEDRLTLVAGEYAVVRVDDPATLRATWIWLLQGWLPTSGRREKNAPEIERFSGISEAGLPVGPVELWIPLEPADEA